MGKENLAKNLNQKKRQKLQSRKGLARLKTRVLLVVDGKTESEYFARIRTLDIFPNYTFKIIYGDENSFRTIVQENFDIPHKYLILDIDNCPTSDKARGKKITALMSENSTKDIVFFNNYSFETFLLNHCRLFARPIMSKKQYDKDMKKYFGIEKWSKYKNDDNICLVMSKIDLVNFNLMLDNIAKIYKPEYLANPNSNMHLLFKKLTKG